MNTRSITALVIFLAVVLLISACSNRKSPAPVVELYQGKSFYDFEKQGYSGDKYIVTKGDTLFSIAWFSGNDYRDLARINRISPPYAIYPGQELKLKSPPIAKRSPSASGSGQTSKIKPKQTVDRSQKQAYGESYKNVNNANKRSETIEFPNRISKWIWPAQGQLAKGFSLSGQTNKGIEIVGRRGDTVVAAADGKVVYTGNALRGYGQLVIIKHSESYLSAYAHNDAIFVNEQQWIKAGQKIASMGDSGTDKVKLRFEVRYKGKSVDPMRYLPKT